MITQEQANKRFDGETLICTPTDKKRFIIPVFGFLGAKDTKRPEYLPPDYQMVMQDVKGLEFFNPKDNALQVLKQKDGCLICYDAPGLKEKVEAYIQNHSDAFLTVNGIQEFIGFLSKYAIDPTTGKADIYDTDIDFASGLVGAPSKDKIKPGKVFSGAKKKETVQAFKVTEGTEFTGPTGTPQVAQKGGAYILKDTDGMRMIQADVFQTTYAVVRKPAPSRIVLPSEKTK